MKLFLQILVGIILFLIFAAIIMMLWPIVMVPLFHLPVITYNQSLALLLICNLLFKGGRSST